MRVAIFAIACLVIAQASFLGQPAIVAPTAINGTVLDLNDYYNGVWAYFNLSQSNAISCWNDITAENYFQYLQAFYDLAGSFSAGDHANSAIYSAEVEALNVTLYEPLQCVLNSQDYQNLLVAMGISNFNKSLESIMNNMYYQGHLADWFVSWGSIYNLLIGAEYNQAGYAYAPILQTMSQNGTQQNAYFEALEAFQNGMFFWTNLTTPFELPTCYNASSAQPFVDFLFLWTQTVYNSTVENVVNNTNAWFTGSGGQLIPIIQPIFNCEDTTQDQVRLNNALGIDIHSQAFQNALEAYINNDTQVYYNIFSKMYDMFTNFNPMAAGVMYGEFVILVAQSVGPISS
jgi:ribosomal protein S8